MEASALLFEEREKKRAVVLFGKENKRETLFDYSFKAHSPGF